MSPRHTAPGCQITLPSPDRSPGRPREESRVCGQPLAPGSRFCAKHTADAVRLGGRWEA